MYTLGRKGPRMRKGKYSKSVITKELYKKFLEKFPTYNNMTWQEFSKNWEEITETIRDEVVNNPLGVKLGSFTGELKLQYLPYKFKAADHNTSGELDRKTTYNNIHSRGKVAKLIWNRKFAVGRNKILQLFGFEADRRITDMGNASIRENPDTLRIASVTFGDHGLWSKLKK